MSKYFARIDSNQPEIVRQLRKRGCFIVHTYTLKEAFDVLVAYKGSLYPVEIKVDASKKLTKGEQKCSDGMKSAGVEYLVITSATEFFEKIKKK